MPQGWNSLPDSPDTCRQACSEGLKAFGEVFAAERLTPEKPVEGWIRARGTTSCHECSAKTEFSIDVLLNSGTESSILSCKCGAKLSLLVSDGKAKNSIWLVVSPFSGKSGNPQFPHISVLEMKPRTKSTAAPSGDHSPSPKSGVKAALSRRHREGQERGCLHG